MAAPVAEASRGGRLRAEWRACIAAFTFLTRLPAFRLSPHDASDLPAAALYFPLVGVVVAGIGGIVYWAAAVLWPRELAVVFAVASTAWITGAFHEDAVADAFDGFGGGWTRDQVLTIMKDSRVGSYALVGVTLLLLAKVGALSAITAQASDAPAAARIVIQALVAGHVLGRWSSLPLMWRYSYVRPTIESERPSAGKPFVDGVSTARLVVATAVSLGLVIAAAGWKALIVVGCACVIMELGGRYARRRIGGITGDVLGAVNQFVELSVYLVLAARPSSLQ